MDGFVVVILRRKHGKISAFGMCDDVRHFIIALFGDVGRVVKKPVDPSDGSNGHRKLRLG